MKSNLVLSLVSLLVIACVRAQNPDPLRAETGELMEKAQRAKAEGRGGEAEDLMRKAKELQAAHAGHEKGKMERARHEAAAREIEALHRAGKHEEAERLKQKMAGAGPGPNRPGPLAEGRERLAHISQAIEHTRAAGLREETEHLEQAARRMKEEMAHRGAPAGGPISPERMHAALGEMHERMEDLRRQMQKMAHATEDLRERLDALQSRSGK